MKKNLYKYITLIFGLFVFISCRLHKEINKEENKDKILLNKSSIKLEINNINNDPNLSEYTLGEYIKQKPNRKFLLSRWMPYTGVYLRAEDRFKTDIYKDKIKKKSEKSILKFDHKIAKAGADSLKVQKHQSKKTKKITALNDKLTKGNKVMQSINQAPAWINDTLTNLSISQLSLYMESIGYFNSKVELTTESKRRKRAQNLDYIVTPNKAHTLTRIELKIPDDNIKEILEQNKKESFLKKGDNFNINNISSERDRIYNLLKNKGYYDFHRQYINFEVDTLNSDLSAEIQLEIQNPPERKHIQYTITKINVLIDIEGNEYGDTIKYKGINYFQHKEKKYSKKILNDVIVLELNDVYSQDKSRYTKNNLGNLDIVKFVNLNYLKSDSAELSAIISIKTQKNYEISSEAGANLSVNNAQTIPGPYVNVKIKDRKVFKGFEALELNTIYSIQGQASMTRSDSLTKAQEFSSTLSLTFPKLLIPAFIKKTNFLTRQNPFKDNVYTLTKFSLGYKNINRLDFIRSNINFNMKYEWKKGAFERFYFNPLEVIIIKTPYKTQFFSDYLDLISQKGGINLKQSFQSSVITNLTFGYMWNNIDMTKNKSATMIKVSAEIGGLVATFIDKISNDDGKLFNLPFTKYYKVSTDLRKYIPITKYSNFVMRLAGGYEKTILGSETLPYEKYFFTGGVSSNRAWRARRLGPGNYVQDASVFTSGPTERPGEILFEANLEYRTKISGIFNTAFFIDASNVWTNEKQANRPGSEFDILNLHRSIGIGAGTGLRFDFSLIIARFDLGWKVFDPETQNFVKFDPLKPLFNFGIGYPF